MSTPSAAQSRRAALGSFVGAVVEWYDFLLYGLVAATVLGQVFFPESSPVASRLAAFATLGVGFLFRPLGGIIFGHFGDRIGRKRMLVWTMTIMGVATALIGLLPTYAQIGWVAPLLLVVLRCVQGLAVGGEWGGAAMLAVENAPRGLRALFSSGVQIGYSVGLLLSTAAVSLLNSVLSDEAFTAWGWRIPFIFSALLVALGLWVRAGVEESQEFRQVEKRLQQEDEPKRLPLFEAVRRYPAQLVQIIGLRFIELFSMYVVTTFALAFAVDNLGFERQTMLNVNLFVGGLGILTIPLFAYLADRFGRMRVYLFGVVVGVVFAFPFFFALDKGAFIGIVICAIILVNIAHDAVVAVQQPLFASMFPAEFRYSGAGTAYQVAAAIAGGFTPFIATWLVAIGNGSWLGVAIYLVAGCLISGLCGIWVARTHREAH
ncbi:Proline/betaine transporter [Brevibacterium ravenspurgense]|uniref:Putative proline/betaine transporter n=1 Tax=Brevibacterium ravenspurgense TaxID=479117 RepID=A0A150H717_9MICO|nr:shikimate transporter [Brevibacterium ravenspurgense]KXZ57420.1 Proline/betaine transporter [Brevibacterium ravenspurgense]